MKNYIGQCITPKVSPEHIAKVVVPEGGLHAGQVVIVDTLDNTIAGNIEVYTATQPTTEKLGGNFVAMVVNDGFETLEDGRRPAGDPNYYHYEYKAGDVATVVFLERHLTFNVGADSITNGADITVGQFLYPVNASNDLTSGASLPAGTAMGLKVIAKYNTPIGGQFGGQFATSYICVAQ